MRARQSVDDGQWHDVAVTYSHDDGQVRLFVDGRRDGQGTLPLKTRDETGQVVRIGYAAPDFPEKPSYFDGQIAEVRFHEQALSNKQVAALSKETSSSKRSPARKAPPTASP